MSAMIDDADTSMDSASWAAYRQLGVVKRKRNLTESTRTLSEAGVPFKSFNGGVHLQMNKGTKTINYWPSTGLWMVVGEKTKQRGIHKLLKYWRSLLPDNSNAKATA